MWCRNCQQDVPAIGSTDESPVQCARCHKPVSGQTATPEDATATDTTPPNDARVSEAKADWLGEALREDWELEDELSEAQHLVTSLVAPDGADAVIRFDGAHLPDGSREPLPGRTGSAARPKRRLPAQSSFFSWCLLSLGMMAFVFGAVLIGWSFAQGRPDLWRLGLPFALGGQAALIVGFVFQLDSLWRSNREAAETLDALESQLDELRHQASLLSTTHSNSARSFYLRMAEGASPHLLLADLKGQLDLLSHRIADRP